MDSFSKLLSPSSLVFNLAFIIIPIVSIYLSDRKSALFKEFKFSYTSYHFIFIIVYLISRSLLLFDYHFFLNFVNFSSLLTHKNLSFINGVVYIFIDFLFWSMVGRVKFFQKSPRIAMLAIANLIEGVMLMPLAMIIPGVVLGYVF